MDMGLFIRDKNYIGPLAWLGRHDWLRWERLTGGVLVARPDRSLLRTVRPEEVRRRGTGFMNRVASFLLGDTMHPLVMQSFFVRSKILAGGPKLFRPTAEQCRAMENTEANICFQDYRQPYPALIIEWPDEYRREKERQGLTGSFPPFTLAYHLAEHRTLFTDLWWSDQNHIVSTLTEYQLAGEGGKRFSPEEAQAAAARAEQVYGTLEEALQGVEDVGGTAGPIGPDDARLLRLVQRLTANFNLMMLTFGHRDTGPTDPTTHSRLVRQSHNRKDRRAAESRGPPCPARSESSSSPRRSSCSRRKARPTAANGRARMPARGLTGGVVTSAGSTTARGTPC